MDLDLGNSSCYTSSMQPSITTINQQGEITLPKIIRDSMKLKAGDPVRITVAHDHLTIKKVISFLDLAGIFEVPKGKNSMKAREEMENNYTRF